MQLFINVGLIVGVLVIVGSWVAAVQMIKSTRYGAAQATTWAAEVASLNESAPEPADVQSR